MAKFCFAVGLYDRDCAESFSYHDENCYTTVNVTLIDICDSNS